MRLGFEGVAEGVAEVQDAALPDSRSSADTTSALMRMDSAMMWSTTGAPGRELPCGGRQGFEERLADDNTGLDDFIQAGAVFAFRQRSEDVGINQDGKRLMEATDEVLASHQIDAGLASDGGIDLCEQRGRDLNDGNAAHEDRCGETRRRRRPPRRRAPACTERSPPHEPLLGQLLDCESFLVRSPSGISRNSSLRPARLKLLASVLAAVLADARRGDDEYSRFCGMISRSAVAAERSKPRSTSTS